ncbi:hypothetical protein MMC07_006698 [Pseudocyphellaria aurata]|nr:hypothetical protein [Pseudocyphellaria aurata]
MRTSDHMLDEHIAFPLPVAFAGMESRRLVCSEVPEGSRPVKGLSLLRRKLEVSGSEGFEKCPEGRKGAKMNCHIDFVRATRPPASE